MKTILFFFAMLLMGVSAQAQTNFEVNPVPVLKGFDKDSATIMRIRCINVQIDQTTALQRPGFLIELISSDSSTVLSARNVYYEDLKNACIKNNIPEEQHETVIQGLLSAVFCGTKVQKRYAINAMLAAYNISLKE